MRNGFSFKEKHSSEFGVTVKTKSRPIRPDVKSFTVDLPCRDGVYDFSSANPSGREHYYERVITVSVGVTAQSLSELQNKLSRLALWLSGSGKLVFDDMPYTVWYGRLSDEIVYLPEKAGKSAVLEAVFRVAPFSTCAFTTEGPVLDFDIPLDANIPIGIDAHLTGSVSGSGTVTVLNFGDRPVYPTIKITGQRSNIVITAGDKTLFFSSAGEATVDCKNQNVTDSDGYIDAGGEFFELQPGLNTLHIETTTVAQTNIEVSYSPEFTYAVNFDDLDWGEGDA